MRNRPRINKVSLKVRRTTFRALAFIAFGYILDLSVFKKSLHLDFSAAGTKEFLGGAGST
jgi:hypothetical protein